MKNKLSKKQKLEKKLENYEFWRHCYILPLMGGTLLSATATIISFIISICTGSFAVTGILAIIALICTSSSIAGYKLNDFIDAKFYNKILELRNELKNIDDEILNHHSQLPVNAKEDEIVTAKEDIFANAKLYKVNKKEVEKLEKEEYKNIDENNLDL